MKYTKIFMQAVLRKALPTENRSSASVSVEMGVGQVTCRRWIKKYT